VPTRPARLAIAVAVVLLGAVGCMPDEAGTSTPTPGPGATASVPDTTASAPDATPGTGVASADATATPADTTLDVLVTSDDGVGAAGLDAIARALAALPDTTVRIVAPAANQSGTGGKTSDGAVNHSDTTTASGLRATEVNGYPADAVNVALDDLGLKPDLVVSGIHEGQSLGPDVDTSGTIGAARAAAQRGIPALAASLGLGDTYDYDPAVKQILTWIATHRADLLTTPAATRRQTMLFNLNVPNCYAGGSVRGLRALDTEPQVPDPATARQPQTCTTTSSPGNEVASFNAGYATLTTLYPRPTK